MATEIDLLPVFRFLAELAPNNMKSWFDAHRAGYEEAKAVFHAFVSDLIDRIDFAGADKPAAKDCIFRLNRDLRFSRDKTPYKTHFAAYIAPGGRKSPRLGLYVHLEPLDHSLAAGGLYEPTPEQLRRLRRSIADEPRAFLSLTEKAARKGNFLPMDGNPLKKVPAGFDPESPAAEYLKMRAIGFGRKFSDQEALAPGFAEKLLEAGIALRPVFDYLETAAGIRMSQVN
jgi:uncharacterized protein (TIGR02453 family)